MSEKERLNIRDMLDNLSQKSQGLRRYIFVIFIVFVGILYSFLFLRINTLSSTQPSEDAISSKVSAARVPHIDEEVVNQLKSLQDNHTSVRSLFNEARSNPFQY